MSSPFATEVDPRVSLGIDGVWTDITDDVLFESGITIERGSSSDVPRLEAASGKMVLKPSNGRYMRLNPESDLYGKLMMDQPVRIDRWLIHQDFSVAASNGLSATDEGLVWSLYGEGGTVQNSDFSVSGGTARFSIPVASAHRMAYLNTAQYRYGEVITSFQLPAANITGGGIGVAIVLRGQSSTSYAECNVFIDTDESISVVTSAASNSPPVSGETATGIVHTGQQIWVAAGADGHSLYMKVWEGTIDDEPVAWLHVGDGSFVGGGFIGLKASRYASNSNTSPFVVQFGEFYFRQARLVGVVPDWSPRWDTTGRFENTPIVVSGIVRRLDTNEQPVLSPLRAALPSTEGLVAYWPCEDEKGAQSFASALADNAGPMTWAAESATTGPKVAEYNDFVASKPIPTVGKARWRGVVPVHDETGVAHIRFIAHFPSTDMDNLAIICQFYTTGTAVRWELKYLTGGSCQLDAFDSSNTTILSAGPFALDLQDKKVRFALQIEQTGSDITWLVSAPEEGDSDYGYTAGPLVGHTMGRIHDLRFAVGNPGVNYGDLAIGHITVSNVDNDVLDMWEPFAAYNGELDYVRATRICAENDIDFRLIADNATLAQATPMGPQPIANVVDVLNDIADTGQNALYETRSIHNGVTLRLNKTMRNQTVQLALDLADGHLEDALEPDDDPDQRHNDITAKRRDGSSYRVEQTDGPFSIAQIGRRATDYTSNPQFDTMLRDIANFRLVLSTINEYLYRRVATSLDNSAVRADHALCRQILDLELCDRMLITGGESRKLFNEIEQFPRGYVEELDQFRHRFAWNTVSGSPYITSALGDTEYDSLTSSTTTLLSDIDDNDITFSITRALGEPMWSATDPPDKIMMGGERCVLTSVDNPATPSFVAAGTASHADNANVTPGLPAGMAAGDTMIIFVGCRNSAMTTAVTGYTLVGNVGNIQIWVKTHTGSESGPTVVVSGGAAGNTVSAQMCALRNIGPFPVFADAQANASAQNISVIGDYEPQATWVAIQFGWKADDWTSVSPPQYMTEIGEPSSTLGSDQGITWAYKIGTDHVNVGDGTFTVTGGASAISTGVIMVWGTRQTMTVVRSDNQVVKSHLAGTVITAWRETYLGIGKA